MPKCTGLVVCMANATSDMVQMMPKVRGPASAVEKLVMSAGLPLHAACLGPADMFLCTADVLQSSSHRWQQQGTVLLPYLDLWSIAAAGSSNEQHMCVKKR